MLLERGARLVLDDEVETAARLRALDRVELDQERFLGGKRAEGNARLLRPRARAESARIFVSDLG